ncbi:MAG: sortase [Oscillospiraceae bacterium]|nr:sortase [Oscillospiraceae bacterium]
MSHNKRRSRSSPLTAVLAVILFLAGIAAVGASLWMQENEITTGAEAYETLSQQLKLPDTTEEAPDVQEADDPENTVQDAQPVQTPEEQPSAEESIVELPAEITEEPSVTVIPPLPVVTTEPAVQETTPTMQPVISKPAIGNSGYTGADLDACKAINSDFIGWLQIPGTKVDYPVVLTNDVDYYLDHTFDRQENIIGCLFSLGKSDYSTPSRNIAVYGHHMRRSRSTTMFQPLHEYKSASFRNAHADITFDTLYGSRSYTVFAVINKRESDWDASAADFASVADNQAFLDRAQEWSLYDTGVHVSTDDHILTLITCDRDYHSDDGQLVVMAVQN